MKSEKIHTALSDGLYLGVVLHGAWKKEGRGIPVVCSIQSWNTKF